MISTDNNLETLEILLEGLKNLDNTPQTNRRRIKIDKLIKEYEKVIFNIRTSTPGTWEYEQAKANRNFWRAMRGDWG